MKKIFLVTGFMTAGKTTAARAAAASLGMVFCDLDEFIEATAGLPVAQIFSRNGEQGFRELEHQCFVEVWRAAEKMTIVAAGGGLPTYVPNYELIRQCTVVFLDTGWPVIQSRIEQARPDRPLLTGLNGAQIKCLWENRRQIYLNLADFVIQEGSQLEELIAKLTAGIITQNEKK